MHDVALAGLLNNLKAVHVPDMMVGMVIDALEQLRHRLSDMLRKPHTLADVTPWEV